MAITFARVTTKQAEAKLLAGLKDALQKHNRVLWIVGGGSSIPLIATCMKAISAVDSARLAVMLSDERFGPVGHLHSNMQQLFEAGFEPKQATIVPVLRPGVQLDETVAMYGNALETAFSAADYVIAQLGIGPDGHTAGILPGSPATKATKKWTIAYETTEFTRITMTPFALEQVAEVLATVFGKSKKAALTHLRDTSESIATQPAQVLKKIANVTVLNDQLGEK
jgi:6-phosphogluconolactonase/glucosamine-6-phosphate isomerase/deaminase